MAEITLRITSRDGAARDATALAQSITWAGDVKNCARTLDFPLLTSQVDKKLPVAPCELGSAVRLLRGETVLFDGFVFSRTGDTGSNTVEVGCVDRGIYLKRNAAAYKFMSVTPEAIARRVGADFGIAVGALAETGTPITRKFSGVSLYKIIQTAYTLASRSTGERYVVHFRGAELEVAAKRQGAATPVLEPGSGLITATVTESVENMVNQVAVYDGNDNRVSVETDGEAVKLYGLMQAYLKQSKDEDGAARAKRMLEDGGVSQKITVTNLGDTGLMAGECVVLKEPVTGLYGLFWIDSDIHTWKNGLYQNKLVLNFRNLMDEQEAGSLPKA